MKILPVFSDLPDGAGKLRCAARPEHVIRREGHSCSRRVVCREQNERNVTTQARPSPAMLEPRAPDGGRRQIVSGKAVQPAHVAWVAMFCSVLLWGIMGAYAALGRHGELVPDRSGHVRRWSGVRIA
jgi:hypothetical protein